MVNLEADIIAKYVENLEAKRTKSNVEFLEEHGFAEGIDVSIISEAIEDIKAGKFVIVVDDETRENEGDLAMAAEKVTPEAINFMAKHARGLICLPIIGERLDELGIPLMVTG